MRRATGEDPSRDAGGAADAGAAGGARAHSRSPVESTETHAAGARAGVRVVSGASGAPPVNRPRRPNDAGWWFVRGARGARTAFAGGAGVRGLPALVVGAVLGAVG